MSEKFRALDAIMKFFNIKSVLGRKSYNFCAKADDLSSRAVAVQVKVIDFRTSAVVLKGLQFSRSQFHCCKACL